MLQDVHRIEKVVIVPSKSVRVSDAKPDKPNVILPLHISDPASGFSRSCPTPTRNSKI